MSETETVETGTKQAPKTKKTAAKKTAAKTANKKATSKKATSKKATSKKATSKKTAPEQDGRKTRSPDARPPGLLEADVKTVTDDYDSGKLTVEGPLTPHRIASLLVERDGLSNRPSTGAITNIIARWEEYGFALVGEKPFHFRRYTAAGKKEGLDALKQKHREKRKASRK